MFLGVSLGLLTQTRTADLAVSLTFSPWFMINVLLLLCDAFKLRSNKIRLVPVTCLNIQCKFMCDRMPDWCCSVGCFVNQSRASEAVMNLYLNLLRIQNCAYSRCCVFGCLHLRQWPMTYLMTLPDWTMSCQPWPPRARYGQWARYK